MPCASLSPPMIMGLLLHLFFPSAEGAGGNLSEMCSTHGMGRQEQGCLDQGSLWKLFVGGRRNQNSRNVDGKALPSCWHSWLCSHRFACRHWGSSGKQESISHSGMLKLCLPPPLSLKHISNDKWPIDTGMAFYFFSPQNIDQ